VYGSQTLYLSWREADFFLEFAPRADRRIFVVIEHPGGDFQQYTPDRMSILSHHDDVPLGVNWNYGDRTAVPDHLACGLFAVRQFYGIYHQVHNAPSIYIFRLNHFFSKRIGTGSHGSLLRTLSI